MITQEEVKELFDYRDGKLFWSRYRPGTNKGKEAGCLKKGYRSVCVSGEIYFSHRIIWLREYGYLPENDIDHINRKKTDNRIENLREATRSCNLRNAKLSKRNTSGIKGVYWCNREGKWTSKIGVNGKLSNICYCGDLLEAACHRLAAEQCLGWEGCDSSSPAFQYVQKHITRKGGC